MRRDIRDTVPYQQAEAIFREVLQPGTGRISDAAEVSTNGIRAVFTGTLADALEGSPPTRICMTELATGDTRVLTFGPNTDHLPKYSPDGSQIAFLSDRHKPGDFQLYLLDPVSGAVRATPPVEGWVEYLSWSPDAKQVLLGVAGHGADTLGVHGAVASKKVVDATPSWMPTVETGDESYRRRLAWVYELATNRVRRVSGIDCSIWEAVWCGNDALAVVASPGPMEGDWYGARLHILEIETGNSREVYVPKYQLGCPAASPSGAHLAIVAALCSDRGFVAGELLLVNPASGNIRHVDTEDVDITYAEWRCDRRLLLAGHRGFETVVGLYDTVSNLFAEVWSNRDISTGGLYVAVSGLNELGDCVLVGESFLRAPEIAVIRNGEYQRVKAFDPRSLHQARDVAVEHVTWNAPDGIELQGWVLRPKEVTPRPLVMFVHGGPVWHWRPMWLGRRGVHILMLIAGGYAVFLPNPRGSSGRGQYFAQHVLGDLGGADACDCLSGLDYLVAQGVADPKRLGVSGGSYGGFMTSWLITHDPRFAAAVPVAPTTNQVTQHLLSNIPQFVTLFLADSYTNPDGKYFQRSPIMHAHKTKTPTLNICGAIDRCAPAEESMQFHHALLENGVKSVLVAYPEEGHGIRKLPAAIDYAARLVAWFQEHMPPMVAQLDVIPPQTSCPSSMPPS